VGIAALEARISLAMRNWAWSEVCLLVWSYL